MTFFTEVPRYVLVEGESDRQALLTLAERRGRDLQFEGISIEAMGGATNISHFLDRSRGGRVAGLCDAAEEPTFRRGLERAGLGTDLDRLAMEALGFFVCVADLEEELIRALGAERVVQVISEQDELEAFRSFQRQPFHRDRPLDAQLRRFMGTFSGRKIRYGRVLVEALDLDRVPRPLDAVLNHF